MPRPNLLKILRVTHLYFGVFITPALLFFALSGAFQTFGLHETMREHPNYKPAHWITVLAQIHKHQTPVLPPPRRTAPAAAPATPRPDVPPAAPTSSATPTPKPHNPVPLKAFFLVVCIGLFTSTATGLFMAYKYNRSKLLVTLTLAAGIVLPLLFLL